MGPPGCLTRKLLPLGGWGPNNALSPTRNRMSLGPSFLSTTARECSLPSHVTSPNRAAEGEAEKGVVGVLGLGAVVGRDDADEEVGAPGPPKVAAAARRSEPVEVAVAGLPSFTPSSLLGRKPWVLSPPDRLTAFATLSAAADSSEDWGRRGKWDDAAAAAPLPLPPPLSSPPAPLEPPPPLPRPLPLPVPPPPPEEAVIPRPKFTYPSSSDPGAWAARISVNSSPGVLPPAEEEEAVQLMPL